MSLSTSTNIVTLQKQLQAAATRRTPQGATVAIELPTAADCVRYVPGGIEHQREGLSIADLAPDQVLIQPVAVSLCGTDIALIDKAHQNALPAEAMGKVVGHEAAGVIVGVGAEVKHWQIGQVVCLDSHYACGDQGHAHFNDCVASGRSCDGIVGGIRGAMLPDGGRAEPIDGYWSRLIVAPVSALPLELPAATADTLAAPSTLESLGNIYMMVGQLKKLDLLKQPEQTLFVVVGLGATGYPMAAVATHYGFEVVGINPSESKRLFALEQQAVVQALPDFSTLEDLSKDKSQVVVVITAGAEVAHQEALDWLEARTEFQRKVAIEFGLFSDATKPLPYCTLLQGEKPLSQRDFVFSRHSFETPTKTEVYGVCGRDLEAWQTLMRDIQPDGQGQPPLLVRQLNAAVHVLSGAEALQSIAETLNQGSSSVDKLLRSQAKLKLAARFIK